MYVTVWILTITLNIAGQPPQRMTDLPLLDYKTRAECVEALVRLAEIPLPSIAPTYTCESGVYWVPKFIKLQSDEVPATTPSLLERVAPPGCTPPVQKEPLLSACKSIMWRRMEWLRWHDKGYWEKP